MSKSIELKTYYNLYCAIQEIPRYTIRQLCPLLSFGGRGQKLSTVTGHILKLYRKKISLRPNLVLRTFENCYTKGYFLKVQNPENISKAFYELMQNPKLSYMLLLSGVYDFFVTSKHDLTFGGDLRILKKSTSYTPIYTIPSGWNSNVIDGLRKITELSLNEGRIERIMEEWLPWEDIDFRIYDIMKNNIQMQFSDVARKIEFSSNTVKKHFYETVMPYCNISHYFFPKGYDYYQKAMLSVETSYETGLVEALSRLPCTTYVFPFENEIILILFHEGIQDVMSVFRKLEEKGYIKKHLLLVPLHWV